MRKSVKTPRRYTIRYSLNGNPMTEEVYAFSLTDAIDRFERNLKMQGLIPPVSMFATCVERNKEP